MNKQYRPNVAGMIMNDNYPNEKKILLGLRNDMNDVWQFPQGGIDKNESEENAFLREMREEIGTDNVEIIDVCPEWIYYDFPQKTLKNGKYLRLE